MTEIRPNIKAIMPSRMMARPVDRRGYPVPWFVTVKDALGEWEFRVLDPQRSVEAVRRKVCWICGDQLGTYLNFVVGPMCGINRISAEPPQHRECAEFAVRACPFMMLPRARRRDANLPAHAAFDELHIPRNPGVMLIWTTKRFRPIRRSAGFLFEMGAPNWVSFWHEGRKATRAEIDASIAGGLPNLARMAEQDGAHAVAMLERMRTEFVKLLPAAEA
jgi:hypothetical protein